MASKVGLPNNGITPHYDVYYDPALPTGMALATGLLTACEQDFSQMRAWFGGMDLPYDDPIPVLVGNGTGGASWEQPPDPFDFGFVPSVIVNAADAPPAAILDPVMYLRYLLVSEITEVFMAAKGNGWFDKHDEGSKGESLSRFLGAQLLLSIGPNVRVPSGFLVTGLWLRTTARQNFVDDNPDDKNPDAVTGCGTAFRRGSKITGSRLH